MEKQPLLPSSSSSSNQNPIQIDPKRKLHRVDERQREVEKWVMELDMTIDQFHAADIDNDGFVSKSDFVIYKLKEMGKITERDTLMINKQFEKLDNGNFGRITLSNIMESHY
ncbi:two pore potassium channel c isoform X2 [Capsicum annuum]|uniref:two pore potassium channel c isoform X2 n=1 Tax=Capsicum annuum TaxID=4072 RepID=UPI0007BF8A1B|nr:two pore potassium channel c isoform X2 [Capsicum annuum]